MPAYIPRFYESTSDTTTTDDGSLAYRAGDYWRNTSSDALFVLLDAAPTAAVWRELTQTAITTVLSITGADASLGIAGQAAAQGGAVAVVGGTSSTAANAGG